jgi:hypothetical protein
MRGVRLRVARRDPFQEVRRVRASRADREQREGASWLDESTELAEPENQNPGVRADDVGDRLGVAGGD